MRAALRFKHSLLTVDVDHGGCLCVAMCVAMSATLRLNISDSKGDRGLLPIGSPWKVSKGAEWSRYQ